MNRRKHDARKARHWQRTIGEAAQSGMSIREFCRQRRLRESQFYWWQHRLKAGREEGGRGSPSANGDRSRIGQPSFALVSDEPGAIDADIELVLNDGRRLRVRQGVEEETLRTVLAALEPSRC